MHDPDRKHHHSAQARRSWRFNPFEIAVCGSKNSGKTTLLEGLAKGLANDLRLAYLKHDAHHFSVDHPGKDTDRLRNAGVKTAVITGSDGFAQLGSECDSEPLAPYPLLAADALLVEGYKASGLPRIMVLDEGLAILDDPAWLDAPPVAIVHPWRPHGADEIKARAIAQCRFDDLPWFDRNDVLAIADFIRQFWSARCPPLHGLVLTGGRSTRMGRDKALVDYHGCTQIEYGVRLLSRPKRRSRAQQISDPVRSFSRHGPDGRDSERLGERRRQRASLARPGLRSAARGWGCLGPPAGRAQPVPFRHGVSWQRWISRTPVRDLGAQVLPSAVAVSRHGAGLSAQMPHQLTHPSPGFSQARRSRKR